MPTAVSVPQSGTYYSERQIKQKNATLEGVVVNNFIKDSASREELNLNDTYNTLLIPDKENTGLDDYINKDSKQDEYETKKAVLPLVAGTIGVFAASALIGVILKKSAVKITTEPFKNKLPPMGLNLNIVEETGFSTYMALRDPSKDNILAAAAVFAFSTITLVAKKFVEGIKEIWVKKQEADVKKELQENLIAVETRAFSGKLAVVRDMLSKKGEYLNSALSGRNHKFADDAVFAKHFNFKGIEKDKEQKNDKPKKINPYIIITALTLAAGIASVIFTFKNFKKTAQTFNDFKTNFEKKQQNILKQIEEGKIKNPKETLEKTLLQMGASKDTVRSYGETIGLKDRDLESFVDKVANEVNNIWGNAPTGMSTEGGKSFFYCYLNQARGHLYNWLIHKDNIFLRYLFAAMTTVSAISYLGQQCADALKEAAVLKENAKTELNLQKRLVDVEIRNFKAKKDSAVEPLIEEFERQRKEGKSPQELKVMADNVLLEIKNGPPFVYS